MHTPQLKLISFKLCPFVQRATISLEYTQLNYDIEYIDLNAPPEWFAGISPRGQVPIVVSDGQPLFESSAITEYINDIGEGQLLASNPIERAQQRAWISVINELYVPVFKLMQADSAEAYTSIIDAMQAALNRLNDHVDPSPYYSGEGLSLVDACAAPIFMRLQCLQQLTQTPHLAGHDKLQRWAEALLNHPQ